nr:uncharacterized protein LOC109184751 [Ipomoea batatas]
MEFCYDAYLNVFGTDDWSALEHAFTGFSIGPPTPTIRRELRHHADEGEATDENGSEATLHVVINASPWAKDIIKVATATEALIGFLLDVAKIAVKGGEAGISGGVTEEEVDEELWWFFQFRWVFECFAREKRQLLPLVTSVYHRCWPGTPSERDGVGIQWRLAGSVALAIFEICSRSPRSACTRARGGGSDEVSQLEDLRPTLLHHPRRWFSLLCCSSSATSQFHQDTMKEMLDTMRVEMEAQMEAKLQAERTQMQAKLQAERTQMETQMQAQIASLMDELRRNGVIPTTSTPQPPTTEGHSVNSNDEDLGDD